MEEKKFTLEFGRKYRVGNFYVLKLNKVLKKYEVSQLRNQLNIPADLRKHLQRAQLPYIKVEAVSGIWALELCCNTMMYQFIDQFAAKAIEADERGEVLEHNSLTDFAHLFSMFFTDTCVLGDSIYTCDKANALNAFMARQKAIAGEKETEMEKNKDDEDLEAVRQNEELKAKIINMANEIKKGGEDEDK